MIIINTCILSGRLVKDVELKFIPSTGLAVANFTLAVDRGLYGDKKKEAINSNKPTADFIQIKVFGKQAENCANFLSKGRECIVAGRINTGSYTTQTGEKRYTTDVIADRIEFVGQAKTGTKEFSAPGEPEEFEDVFTPADDEDIPF